MGFQSGSVSFRQFAVIGNAPKSPTKDHLDKLAAHAIRLGDIGIPEEREYGWCGGRHLLDGDFTFANNVYGDALFFALRVDTNKVPGDITRAYTMQAEQALAKLNPSGFLTKLQKREVKDDVRRQCEAEVRNGKHRKSRMVPVLWDMARGVVYSPATSGNLECLYEIFERTFGLGLAPMTAGNMAQHVMERAGNVRGFENLRPTRFVAGPEGEAQHPEYPWVAKGPQPKDFLGNEFLLWLWYMAELNNGELGEATVYFDKAIDLDCAYGMTGKDAIRGEGAIRMPEAFEAVRSGKLPRKASLLLHNAGNQYAFTLNPELMAFQSAQLPKIEDADTARALFEARIELIGGLCWGIEYLFSQFLVTRISEDWPHAARTIGKWASAARKAVAA